MVEKGTILMSQKDLKRYHVMNQVLEKRMTQKSASKLLGLSLRHLKRLGKRLKTEGPQGLIHKSRAKRSHNSFDDCVKRQVLKSYKHTYRHFGPTLFSEQLKQREGIEVSPASSLSLPKV